MSNQWVYFYPHEFDDVACVTDPFDSQIAALEAAKIDLANIGLVPEIKVPLYVPVQLSSVPAGDPRNSDCYGESP